MDHLQNWREEQRSAYLYDVLAQLEQGTPRAKLFGQLAREARRQAQIWVDQPHGAGVATTGVYRPELRARLVAALLRRFGGRRLRPVLAAMKVRGLSVYSSVEPGHARPDPSTGMERRHRRLASGGNLRAAVFGVNDGLVSNVSLILGVAGATGDTKLILLSGTAGLLAGAFSMAAGEYVSVRSQREMYEYQIGLEREELRIYPEEEAEELALIYQARGLESEEAQRLAASMIADPEKGLDALAREELGLNPDELGSPWGAAAASFGAFAAGALMPLLPFALWRGNAALYGTVAISAIALYGIGASLSLFTGRSAWRSASRMLLIGATAGAATYLIGSLLGVALS